MTMITPSYLGETIEYSSLHACRSTLEDPTGPGFDQPFRGPANAKCRHRREQDVAAQPIRPEAPAKQRGEIAHGSADASTAISARSCAMSADNASPSEQTLNVIVPPGPSWPATLMSAAMTVAIFG